MLVPSGLHLLLLMLTNCWLSLTSQTLSVPQHQSFPVLISNMQSAVLWKRKGSSLTCLSKKIKQCLKHSRRCQSKKTLKENVVCLQRRQNQNNLLSVAVQTLWRLPLWLRAHSWGTRPSDCCRFVSTKRTFFLQRELKTEWNSWITTSIETLTWGTAYKRRMLAGKLSRDNY